MERSWLIDSKGIATKVKCANLSPANQLKDCGAHLKCPNCRYIIDNSDVSEKWPGFPAGVKFDPSDIELLEHLAEKCGVGEYEPHTFIDDFIPTIDREGGICSAHPEDLPGARKDGSSVHFFHRTMNAYASGQRKRRKIQKSETNFTSDEVRWHKTGKTKPVFENGVQKGWKKIMVLYKVTKKSSKPDKADWVMHQYHLGTNEDEPDGQYVISKIFYQKPKVKENTDKSETGDCDLNNIRNSPKTPTTNMRNPQRPGVSTPSGDFTDVYALEEPIMKQEPEFLNKTPQSSSIPEFTDNIETQHWLAGESQAIEETVFDDGLLCHENLHPHVNVDDFGLNGGSFDSFGPFTNDIFGPSENATNGIPDFGNLNFDTTPDFQLTDLPFGSQENIFSWLDRLQSNKL